VRPRDRAFIEAPQAPAGPQAGNESTRRPLFNVRQAAEYLGVSKSFLDKLRVTGEGSPYFKAGRKVLYSPDDLDSWIVGRRRFSTSDTLSGAADAQGQ
jgi:excisionase family DNA binding protein